MRSPRIWHAWRVRWHQWWRDTHTHAAQSAEDDAFRYISWPDDDAEWDYPNDESYGELGRLRKVARSERDKSNRHARELLGLVLDRDAQSS